MGKNPNIYQKCHNIQGKWPCLCKEASGNSTRVLLGYTENNRTWGLVPQRVVPLWIYYSFLSPPKYCFLSPLLHFYLDYLHFRLSKSLFLLYMANPLSCLLHLTSIRLSELPRTNLPNTRSWPFWQSLFFLVNFKPKNITLLKDSLL